MVEAWLARTVERFWEAVGGAPPTPRDLAPLVSRSLPISVNALPVLDIAQIERWFAERSVPYRFLCQNRALCGCIVAARGHGMLFIDANDAAADQRFTVAHEVAHFLLDYLEPRQEAIALLGKPILSVLDGERAPTAEERIHAVLGRVKLGFYQDMMPRTAQGSIDQGAILRAEDRADRLALELLAPAADVLAAATTMPSTPFERARELTGLLQQQYGLPLVVARTYAAALAKQTSRPSVAEWFGC
jgi:hypothetical protein